MAIARNPVTKPTIEQPDIPLTLYVHLPWCVKKCPYCDFNSHAVKDTLPEADYLAALKADLAFALREPALHDNEARPLAAIFFGGGTPSLFSPASFADLLESISQDLAFSPDIEITLEANPGTIEHGRFADYRAAGINRVSLGAQSFDNAALKTLGRIHDASSIHRAAEELHAAGLANFNIDLMTALPGQTVESALADVDTALALGPQHVSLYELTLEPNTLFAVRPPAGLPDEDSAIDILEATRQRLAEGGFERYEVSAFARPGRESRHNLNYWTFGDYLAIGAGAHGKMTMVTSNDFSVIRQARHRHPSEYLARAGSATAVQETRQLSPAERLFEYVLNRSRLLAPAPFDEFEQRTGLLADALRAGLEGLEDDALVALDKACWRVTPRGLEMLNDVQAAFLPRED